MRTLPSAGPKSIVLPASVEEVASDEDVVESSAVVVVDSARVVVEGATDVVVTGGPVVVEAPPAAEPHAARSSPRRASGYGLIVLMSM